MRHPEDEPQCCCQLPCSFREDGVPDARGFRVAGWEDGVPDARGFRVAGWEDEGSAPLRFRYNESAQTTSIKSV